MQTDIAEDSGVTRRRLLTGAVTAGSAVALAGLWRTMTDRVAGAQTDATLDLLNLGLTGEFLLCSAYEEALEYDALAESDIPLITAMLEQTESNVQLFTAAVERAGGEPIERPGFTYPEGAERDREACLGMLIELENVSIAGWQGVSPTVADPELVELARPMAMGKGRRAGALAFMLDGGNPFPAAIEQGRPLAEVLSAIEQYRGMGEEE